MAGRTIFQSSARPAALTYNGGAAGAARHHSYSTVTDIPLHRDRALPALPVLSNRSGVWLGALFSLVVAVVLFTRFSIDARISRDQAIFAYGAQQLIKGVP